MKSYLLLLFTFLINTGFAQSYSRVISDAEIDSFMNFNIHGDSVRYIKSISSKIWSWNLNEIYFKDSSDFNKKNSDLYNTGFIFRNQRIANRKYFTNHLDTIFFREDIEFFKTQIKGFRDKEFWDDPFPNTVFAYANEIDDTNRLIINYYSMPLFSVDRKKVLIINAFYCGLVCGGGSYNVYQKNDKGKWVQIREMNKWAE